MIACNTFVFWARNVMCFLYYLSTNCAKLLTIRVFEMIRTFRERDKPMAKAAAKVKAKAKAKKPAAKKPAKKAAKRR